jgi:hypothetical protein
MYTKGIGSIVGIGMLVMLCVVPYPRWVVLPLVGIRVGWCRLSRCRVCLSTMLCVVWMRCGDG